MLVVPSGLLFSFAEGKFRWMEPSDGGINPAMHERSVVLPEPLVPMIIPRPVEGIWMLTPCRTGLPESGG
jgi:hypothetical protein